LPQSLDAALRSQMAQSRALWELDRQQQRAGVEVPDALATKYPGLGQRWGWFWVFPAPKLSIAPQSLRRSTFPPRPAPPLAHACCWKC